MAVAAAGLRKVTDDMKTHKNPALRQGPAPFKATAPKPVAAPKPAPKATAKPPLTELQNKKWVVVSGFAIQFQWLINWLQSFSGL